MKLYCTLAFLTALACGHCSARSLTRAILAPFQKVFDDHPTYSGHQLMADEWARVALGEGK